MRAADDADQSGEDEDDDGPDDADDRGLLQILLRLDGHEADDDVRHAEVAEAPAEAGDDGLPAGGQAPEVFGEGGLFRGHLVDHGGGEDRCEQHGAEHQHALEEVCPADGGEAAQEGVADDDDGGQIHGAGRVNADDLVEQGAAGFDGGCGVNRVGHEEDDGADDLQRVGLAAEAVGEVRRNRDGVACNDGELAEARGFDDPADGVAKAEADGDPDFRETFAVDGGRQAHEDPRAHVRGAGREGGDPCAHLAVAEEVGLFATVFVPEEEDDTDAHHADEIDDENNKFEIHG